MPPVSPIDYVTFARARLQESRPHTDTALARIEQIERLLDAACNDTVTAAQELRTAIRELEGLPARAAIARAQDNDTLKQDPTPQQLPGVVEAIEQLRSALGRLERGNA